MDRNGKKLFVFDKVLDQSLSQKEVFDDLGIPSLISKVVNVRCEIIRASMPLYSLTDRLAQAKHTQWKATNMWSRIQGPKGLTLRRPLPFKKHNDKHLWVIRQACLELLRQVARLLLHLNWRQLLWIKCGLWLSKTNGWELPLALSRSYSYK